MMIIMIIIIIIINHISTLTLLLRRLKIACEESGWGGAALLQHCRGVHAYMAELFLLAITMPFIAQTFGVCIVFVFQSCMEVAVIILL